MSRGHQEGARATARRGSRRQISRRLQVRRDFRAGQGSATPPPARRSSPTCVRAGSAGRSDRIVAVTPWMPSGTGLDTFGKAFPERTFDVHRRAAGKPTFAAGLATEGYKLLATIYSTFSMPTTRSWLMSRSRSCRCVSRSIARAMSARMAATHCYGSTTSPT